LIFDYVIIFTDVNQASLFSGDALISNMQYLIDNKKIDFP
jgi:hypothetical protein